VNDVAVPTYDSMMNPLLQAIRELGGSGTIEEINGRVIEIMDLSDNQIEILHNPDKGGSTEIEYRLAWTRTYLKRYGVLENSSRGVWALNESGRKVEEVDSKEVVRVVRDQMRKDRKAKTEDSIDEEGLDTSWQDELLDVLLGIDPSAFERLIQRLLRESGFSQVEVTSRSGDGGIDGRGIMRLGGMMSFQVIFQCKRWKNSVGASIVRDFRGAMVGRADKGLLVTTGTFTKEAVKEATRDGAPAIDLIDGDQLLDMLKKFGLGVETRIIELENVSIDKEWFSTL
jgi:restriction system protein